jgi:hypothetical protein
MGRSGAQVKNRIDGVETTEDLLTSRAGLSLFVKYLSTIQIIPIFVSTFYSLRKSRKGMEIGELFRQIVCFFVEGGSRHLTYFDELKKDSGYRATIERGSCDEVASSHTVKRFFRLFPLRCDFAFEAVFRSLFVWRLQIEKPVVIEMSLDSMVMDNDDALRRHGCSPTYKKVKGFHPLHLIWNGMIVSAKFRRGSAASNPHKEVRRMVTRAVSLIRVKYSPDVPIVIRCDSAFFDEKLVELFNEMGVLFIISGKMLTGLKDVVSRLPKEQWTTFTSEKGCQWRCAEFGYRADSWKRLHRTFYTQPLFDDKGQGILEFDRPENVIVTNLGMRPELLTSLNSEHQASLVTPENVLRSHHQRGADELPHRALKDFASQTLPFLRFAHNAAFYYTMVIAFTLMLCWQRDVLATVVPSLGKSYPTTVRRRIIDTAGKFVRTGRRLILKITKATAEALQFVKLWDALQLIQPISP